jgi:hypothetical protein
VPGELVQPVDHEIRFGRGSAISPGQRRIVGSRPDPGGTPADGARPGDVGGRVVTDVQDRRGRRIADRGPSGLEDRRVWLDRPAARCGVQPCASA